MAAVFPFALSDNLAIYIGGAFPLSPAQNQCPVPPGTYKNLRVFVDVNSIDQPTNVRIYKNGVATGLVVTYGVGVTGALSDLVNTLALVEGDRLSCVAEINTTATTGSLQFSASVERDGGGILKWSGVANTPIT